MRELHKFHNVNIYSINEEYIYINDGVTLNIYDNKFKLKKSIKGNCFDIINWGYFILFQKENGGDIHVIKHLNEINVLKDYYLYKNIIDSLSLSIYRADNFTEKFDVNMNSINSFNIGRFPRFIYKDCFIRLPNNTVKCYNIDSNTLLWEKHFSELLVGEDVKQIGDIVSKNGNLYISLYDDKNSDNLVTYGIDIEVGKVLHRYEKFGGSLSLFGDKLGQASYQQASVLDLETNQIVHYNLEPILSEFDIKMSWHRNLFTESGLLYFVGSFNSKNKVGVIDLQANKLLWHMSFEIPESEYNVNQAVMSIQIVQDRLYVHCSDNTLYVYEDIFK